MPALHFGRYVVHRQARELWRDGQRVELQRQSFELLLYLMDHAERAVPKEELLTQVWGTQHVSDSVLARAVMKLRRAIEDDGRIVRTLHGVGYRFVAPISRHATFVNAETSPPPPHSALASPLLGLLPLSNESGDASLAWAIHGLPALMSHMLDAQGQVQCADAQQIGAADQADLPFTQRAQRLRILLGVGDVVALQLHRGTGRLWALNLSLDRGAAAVIQGRVEGQDVAELAQFAVQWLAQVRRDAGSARPLKADVMELLARAAHALQTDRYRLAHTLLGQAVTRAPGSALVHTELADVLRHLGSYREAKSAASRARALAEQEQDPVLQVRARYLEISICQLCGDLHEARLRLDEGRAQAMQLQGSVWPSRWALLSGSIAHFQHQLPLAMQEMELAVVLATTSRDVVQQVQARSYLAGVLQSQGRLMQAMATLDRAQQLLARTRSEMLEGRLVLAQASIQLERKSFSLAIAKARQAQAVFETSGHAYMACLAAFVHIEALIHGGVLGAAAAEAERLDQQFSHRGSTELPLPQADDVIGFWWEEIAWRRGHHGNSLKAQQALLIRLAQCETFRTTLHEYQSRVAAHLLSLGQIDAANTLRETLDVRDAVACARLDAALALAQGKPLLCIERLEQLWRQGEPGNMLAIDTTIDLAWLLLSHPCAQPAATLPRLMADVEDFADEYLPAVLVRARFLAQRGDTLAAQAELARAVRQAHEAPVPWVHRAQAACLAEQPWPEPQGLLCHALWD